MEKVSHCQFSVGTIAIEGPGAGSMPTGHAVAADVVAVGLRVGTLDV